MGNQQALGGGQREEPDPMLLQTAVSSAQRGL